MADRTKAYRHRSSISRCCSEEKQNMAVYLARSRVFSAVENFVIFKNVSPLRDSSFAQKTVRDFLRGRRIHSGQSSISNLFQSRPRGRYIRQTFLERASSRRWQSQDSSAAETALKAQRLRYASYALGVSGVFGGTLLICEYGTCYS